MGQIKIPMPEPELIPGMAYERNPDGTIKTEIGAGGCNYDPTPTNSRIVIPPRLPDDILGGTGGGPYKETYSDSKYIPMLDKSSYEFKGWLPRGYIFNIPESLRRIINSIARKNGKRQSVFAIEEMAELTKELMKNERHKDNDKEIISESCDVLLAVYILLKAYNVSDADILENFSKKLNRLRDKL